MNDHHDRMNALEQLRSLETEMSLRVHQLRRWVRADLARRWTDAGFPGMPPDFPEADRIELWWRPVRGREGEPGVDRETFDRIEVLGQWLAHFDSAVADRALAEQRPEVEPRRVEPYRPGKGDGTPLLPVLQRIILDLWTAQELRERAGIRPS